jgi:hypothetical protein
LGAADAGAAIVHIHVRDPKTGAPSMQINLYREVVERILAKNPQLDLNTMNSGKQVVINTPGNVRKMAEVILESGVVPEIELFDSGGSGGWRLSFPRRARTLECRTGSESTQDRGGSRRNNCFLGRGACHCRPSPAEQLSAVSEPSKRSFINRRNVAE